MTELRHAAGKQRAALMGGHPFPPPSAHSVEGRFLPPSAGRPLRWLSLWKSNPRGPTPLWEKGMGDAWRKRQGHLGRDTHGGWGHTWGGVGAPGEGHTRGGGSTCSHGDANPHGALGWLWHEEDLARSGTSFYLEKKMFYFIGSFKNSELQITLKLKLNRIEIKIISE